MSREGIFPAKTVMSEQDTPTAGVKLGALEEGKKIGSHTHNECDQLEYYFKGRALMFLEGLGERDTARIIHVHSQGTNTWHPEPRGTPCNNHSICASSLRS